MPVLETDFLKALIDPRDRLHPRAERALEKLSEDEGWKVASTAILELDLILKSRNFSDVERREIFEALSASIHGDKVLKLDLEAMRRACELRERYAFVDFYFDSLHLAIALSYDSVIVSSDESFDEVTEVERIPLEEL